MWRCVIAIAHADGLVQEEERAYIQKILDNLGRLYALTPEQKATFARELDAPKMQSISELLSHINDPATRADLIYFGGLLAYADGVLDPREEEILKKLRATTDMAQIHTHVKEAVADEMFRTDLARDAVRPQQGLCAILDRLLLRAGIDLLD